MAPRPTVSQTLLWLALPACASVLLLATTNKLCQDVAVIPFLWVLPLGLYLLTFIVCFDSPRWYSRLGFGLALGPGLAAVSWALFKGADVSLIPQVIIYLGALLVCCMVCHGELYRLRPPPRFLTAFYLMIALGGALGGLLVAVVAPVVFTSYVELHWGLGACLLLFLIVCLRDRDALSMASWRVLAWGLLLLAFVGLDRGVAWATQWLKSHPPAFLGNRLASLNWIPVEHLHWLIWIGVALLALRVWMTRRPTAPANWHLRTCALLMLACAALGTALARQAGGAWRGALSVNRNFYGVLSVWEYERDRPENHYLLLQHGRITHGLQFIEPSSALWPTTYYGEQSGIGLALRHLPRPKDRVIGVIGLGTGTLAVYGQTGDRLRFYEINPEVRRVAEERFTYLKQSPARVEVVLGDARLSLEREPPQAFDLLALDAFSSDAIPVHLLTREAFEIYLRHLKPDGVVAVHISNQYLNLAPAVSNLAAHFRLRELSISENSDLLNDDGAWWQYASTWVLLTRNEAFLEQSALRDAADKPAASPRRIPLWTDDHTSLFPLLD